MWMRIVDRAVLLAVAVCCGMTFCKAAEEGATGGRMKERLGRGLIARPLADGSVYLGWRLLETDPPGVGFNVYREAGQGKPVRLTEEPVSRTTDFTDTSAPAGTACRWYVRAVIDGREGEPSRAAEAVGGRPSQPYLRIELAGDYTFQKAGIADLDGDGRYDFVIKQPNENIDPYVRYWKPSPGTYKLEAYDHDGRFLWRYDLGWAIERGIWYSPYVVYDLDGDGRAEVAAKTGEGDPRDPDGRVRSGPEYLSLLEGTTGRVITRVDWPSREGFDGERGYNYASRNQLCVAYLDGRRPHLVVERGTYNIMKLVAYTFDGRRLREVWRWDNTDLPRSYWGQGAHWMHAADVDGDGRDEVVLGSSVVDHNGKALWSTGLGHPDHCYVGDIDPDRPGLEIYYGMETRQRQRNGMCLVDAATGKILWGHEGFTRHVHSRGMCSDIDPRYRGSECYSADTDSEKRYAWSKLRTCRGEVISEENLGGFGALVVHWDADPQRELILDGRVQDYRGGAHVSIQGHVAAIADVVGDWREEIITSVRGQLRIYTTTIPARDRRVCLMQDPLYRMDVVVAAMGYYQAPMTSYDLATSRTP
ncbi:MAG TPA: silent information regulator protein Sir2 [Planctomycetaceae bacterium]|nr:silent information regulator protein Sir2 [Planctomycetaceae bacterium]HIQ22201.1 silent information regulator protein Sir2 [Planctomycetota bacterium]